MTHQSEEIIIGGLLRPWHEPSYPAYVGVREHFTTAQLARLDSFAHKEHFTIQDKLFLWRMYFKLIFSGEDD